MDPSLPLRGLVVGFSIAAPVGPIGLLCIQRTLTRGRAVGLATGLGVATADALYGGVAGFGVVAVTRVLAGRQDLIRLLGGLALVALGLRIARSRPAERAARAREGGLAVAYFSTLLLTLANPLTILSFAAVFAGLGAAGGGGAAAAALVAGVFAGSALWWLVLTSGVSLLQPLLGPRSLRMISRASGAAIAALGGLALLGLLR